MASSNPAFLFTSLAAACPGGVRSDSNGACTEPVCRAGGLGGTQGGAMAGGCGSFDDADADAEADKDKGSDVFVAADDDDEATLDCAIASLRGFGT
jgi:hypothetical protein